MNILPFVFAFLAILALNTSLYIQRPIALGKIKTATCSLWKGEREWRNLFVQKTYKNAHPPEKIQKKKTKRKLKRFGYARSSLKENGKLNLSWLIDGTEPIEHQKLLKKIVCQLLKETYGHANFYQAAEKKWDNLEEKIIDYVVEQAKKNPESSTISEIPFEESEYHKILFYMVKGTNQFDFDRKKGYPPLGSIVALKGLKNQKPIVFSFAAKPLLKALVGEELTASIIEMEGKKWEKRGKEKRLSEKELKDIFSFQLRSQISWESFQILCSLSRKSGKNRILSTPQRKNEIVARHDLLLLAGAMEGEDNRKSSPSPQL